MPPPERIAATEVIRPAAVVPEDAARNILVELALHDVKSGGLWRALPNQWARWSQPWADDASGEARLVGTVELAYGTPSRYEVTIFRVSVTEFGEDHGWTVRTLVDESLSFAGMTLDDCPRTHMPPPPAPVKI